jgi:hypothetical protein
VVLRVRDGVRFVKRVRMRGLFGPALARQTAPCHALAPAVPRAARAVHGLVARVLVLRGGEHAAGLRGGVFTIFVVIASRGIPLADGGVFVARLSRVARVGVRRGRSLRLHRQDSLRPERAELRLAGDELVGRLLAVAQVTEPGVVRAEALNLGAQRVVVARQRVHLPLQLTHLPSQSLREALRGRRARVAVAAEPGASAGSAGSAEERAERRGRAGGGGVRGVREDAARAHQRESGLAGTQTPPLAAALADSRWTTKGVDSSLVMPGTGGETRMTACEGTAEGTARAGLSSPTLSYTLRPSL